MTTRMSTEELIIYTQWWQRELGIADWVIDVRLARGYELGASNGSCEWSLALRRGSIRVLLAGDADPNADPMDMEVVLVHELLHIVFANWDNYTRECNGNKDLTDFLEDVCIEQPVEQLARLLVKLRRSCETTKEKKNENGDDSRTGEDVGRVPGDRGAGGDARHVQPEHGQPGLPRVQ